MDLLIVSLINLLHRLYTLFIQIFVVAAFHIMFPHGETEVRLNNSNSVFHLKKIKLEIVQHFDFYNHFPFFHPFELCD